MRCFPTAPAAAVMALLVLASCGDDGGQTASEGSAGAGDPEVLMQRYYAALGRGDGRAVCGLMTTAARQGMKQLPEGERAGSCERAVAVLARDTIQIRRPQLRNLRVSGRGATATVTSKDPPYESGVLLRREDGGWKVAYPPGFSSKFDSPPGIRPHVDEHENER